MTEEIWNKVINTNLKSAWAMTKACVPAMKKRDSAAIVLVSSTAAQADWHGALTWAALALIMVRALAKVGSLVVTSWGSGLSPRKSFWVGVTMVPMSSVALLLTSQFAAAAPGIGERVAAIALPVILVTELVGAVLVTLALYHSGEAAKPWRRRASAPDTPEGPPSEMDPITDRGPLP